MVKKELNKRNKRQRNGPCVFLYKENGYGEYVRHQPHRHETCQLKATHWSSIKDEEILTPLGRLQLVPKQHYTVTTNYKRIIYRLFTF